MCTVYKDFNNNGQWTARKIRHEYTSLEFYSEQKSRQSSVRKNLVIYYDFDDYDYDTKYLLVVREKSKHHQRWANRINPIESVTSKHIQCGKNIDPTTSIEQTKRNEAKWNSKDSNTGRTILSPAYRRKNTHFIIAHHNIIYASLKSSSLASSAPAVIAAINPANSANSSVPLPSRSIDANKIS